MQKMFKKVKLNDVIINIVIEYKDFILNLRTVTTLIAVGVT